MDDESDNSAAREPAREKPPKTAEDLEAIAILDNLRAGGGDTRPEGLPLACVVKVTDYVQVHKAREAYAMATVEGPEGRTWRLCVYRGSVRKGRNALFVSDDAALPDEKRWRNDKVCSVKERVWKFGFGIKVRRLIPFVKRNIYLHNCGVLFPLSSFKELERAKVGTICDTTLHIDSLSELKTRAMQPRPKNVYVPPARPRATLSLSKGLEFVKSLLK